MKVLITGITGFIGRRLKDRLPDGHEYFFLVREKEETLPGSSCIHGDLSNLEALKVKLASIRPDVTVHLAWSGIPDYSYEPSRWNLEEGIALFHWLVTECGCRKIVATGSCWEYGKSFGPCAETDPLGSSSYFTWAKKSLCDFALSLARQEKIDVVWLRLFFVYGPGQRGGALMPTLARALRNNERPSIKTPMDANDYVYVDDVADLIIKAVFQQVSGVYNVGSGLSVPVWQICALMEEAMGIKEDASLKLRQGPGVQAANFWADTRLTSRVFGWEASRGLLEGIKDYLRAQEVLTR